jgi:mRNA-degrading endonuclease RelE of RelBE toxin-antitoxin system
MAQSTFELVYDTEVIEQLKAIERKYHALIRDAIETQLSYEPNVETRNRKPLVRTTPFGARWELRCGRNNRFRVFYSVYPNTTEVHILAIAEKRRERIYIGGKEVEL